MALTIQEGLKDLRVERGLTLEQLAEQTHLSKSALGSYEADAYKDISHYALRNCRKISDADCAGYFFEVNFHLRTRADTPLLRTEYQTCNKHLLLTEKSG